MRKRDIWILAGLGVVVLIVAWYFLLLKPKQDDLSQAQDQFATDQQKLADNQKKIDTIDTQRATARQANSDLLKLNKLVPADEQIPSLIIELQQTANDADVDFMNIKPDPPVAGTGGYTVLPIELKFEGSFFDINDFLYRVENYARMDGSNVTVDGRLVSVVAFKMGEPDVSGIKLPNPQNPNGHEQITMTINAYMTGPPAAPKTGSSSSSGGAKTTGGAGTTGG